MRIDSSNIGMESERTYSSTAMRVTKVTITDSRQSTMDGTDSLFGNLLESGQEEMPEMKSEEEETPQDFLSKTLDEMRAKVNAFRLGQISDLDMEETGRQLKTIKQQCLDYLLALLFPDRERGSFYRYKEGSMDESGFAAEADGDAVLSLQNANVRTFSFSQQYYYEETESTTFTTQGTVRCADGREINFNLNLNMSRSFQEYYEQTYQEIEVSMCDPLVINLDGNIADLSDQTFFFDIDGDGEKDEVNRLKSGSGYLALDRNDDGKVNDGSELFGTASGNGFEDLAAYDEDGNGFIDEGDSIFEKLKIWTMDEDGKEQLISLKEKGVGAICLQSAATDFAVTDDSNANKGMIRRSGFFLYENGTAGSVQHLDVTKYNQAG